MDETTLVISDLYVSVLKVHGGYIINLSNGQRIATDLEQVMQIVRNALSTELTTQIPTV